MDLADIWQEHKKFILVVVGTLLLLLIGRGVIAASYPVDEVAQSASRTSASMARSEEVKTGEVAAVRAQVEQLRERLRALVTQLQFRPDEIFVLAPGEPNPTAFCWRRIRDLQQILVDEAERRDIRVPEKLGLEDAAPTDPEEIRRTLRALNVIHNVVLASINAGVRRIERIAIEDEGRGRGGSTAFVQELRIGFEIVGSEKSLRAVLASLVDDADQPGATYLEIATPTSLVPVKNDRKLLVLQLTVAGLTIAADDLLEDAA